MRRIHVLLVAASLAGCGKSDKKSEPAPAPTGTAQPAPATPPPSNAAPSNAAPDEPKEIKACDLISEADASTALGQPTKYRSKDDSDSCVLDPVQQDLPNGDEITFSAKADGGSMFQYISEKVLKTPTKLEGVGDKAVLEGKDDGMVQFALVKNGKTVHGAAMHHGAKRPGLLDRLQATMKKIAEKL